MDNNKIDFTRLETGFEFPSSSFQIDIKMVDDYLNSVEDKNPLYRKNNLIPPVAIAAFAMSALMKNAEFPGVAIHLSQDIELLNPAHINSTISSRARVKRKQKIGNSYAITIEMNANDEINTPILKGKTMFMVS
jgi:hypothetical protein